MNYGQFLAGLLQHATDIEQLETEVQAFIAASGVAAKWAALKPIGDSLVAILADLEGAATVPPANSKELEATLAASGLNGSRLAKLWAAISQLLPLIEAFLGAFPPAQPTPAPTTPAPATPPASTN